MQIGELSSATGVPTRTIRFYEEKGVLPEPDRSPTGYRIYDAQAVNRLKFLRRAQSAGLTLSEIRGVVAIRDNGEAPCVHTRSLLEAKRGEVDDRLQELSELRSELDRLIETGTGIGPGVCVADEICSIIGTRRPPN
ncbi:MAG: heavy metal-responsive transcriptional regulator [Acidimicrobiia bacterium]